MTPDMEKSKKTGQIVLILLLIILIVSNLATWSITKKNTRRELKEEIKGAMLKSRFNDGVTIDEFLIRESEEGNTIAVLILPGEDLQ